MSVLRSEFDEQRVSSAYDFKKQGKISGDGIQLDIKPPMGANYFRVDKAAIIWGDPSFSNSSSGSGAETEAETEATSYSDPLTMKWHAAYQDVLGVLDITALEQTGWHECDSNFQITFLPAGSTAPSLTSSVTVTSKAEALTAVQNFVD
jgi:hypothetical protein